MYVFFVLWIQLYNDYIGYAIKKYFVNSMFNMCASITILNRTLRLAARLSLSFSFFLSLFLSFSDIGGAAIAPPTSLVERDRERKHSFLISRCFASVLVYY